MSSRADFVEDRSGGALLLAFSGRLTLAQIGDLPDRLAALPSDGSFVIDLFKVERMDTVGAFLIHRLRKNHQGRVALTGASAAMARLIEQVAGRSEEHTSKLQTLMRISYALFCLHTKK